MSAATTTPATKQSNGGVTREEAFANILGNEAFLGLALQGMDGVHVPANRMPLAIRSPLLQRMLYGSFAESNSDIVEIGYEGWILRAIVHYCHTDKVVEALGFELDDEIGHDDTVVDERCEERECTIS